MYDNVGRWGRLRLAFGVMGMCESIVKSTCGGDVSGLRFLP